MAYQESLSALSDPRRRAIFEALRHGPRSVADIAQSQPVSRPAVSQHLKVLETAGLVMAESHGTRRIYRIRPEGLASLRNYLEGFWQDTLDAFKAHVKTNTTTNSAPTEKETDMLPPVIKTITVPCSPERAFTLFTTDIASWWPLDKHSCAAMVGETAQGLDVDAQKDGEIWEIDHEGTRVLWGSFAEFTPHSRIGLNWHINRPATDATNVAVEFEPEGNGTKVTLTHSNWEVHGDEATKMRDGYNNGWVFVFETKFKAACQPAASKGWRLSKV